MVDTDGRTATLHIIKAVDNLARAIAIQNGEQFSTGNLLSIPLTLSGELESCRANLSAALDVLGRGLK